MLPHTYLGQDITYEDALQLQEDHVIALRDGEKHEHLYLLQHAPVYTIGRTRDRSSLLDPQLLPHPLVEISRGGQATYHGPGQLVGYPILDLSTRKRDLHLYIRLLEQSIIDVSSDFGVTATRRDGMTGVWVEDRKLASIGVGVRRWISLHGFALNVTRASLAPFLSITPCGLSGVSMTCLESESQTSIRVKDVARAYVPHLTHTLKSLV